MKLPQPFRLRRSIAVALSVVCLSLIGTAAQAQQQRPITPNDVAHLAREVNGAILSIPFLSVFDNIQYDVMGTQVTLRGQVVLEATKHDAEDAVKHVEGVSNVVDQIEVLPVDPMDQQIRRAEYRAIYGDPALERYAVGALPPIHIVVERGHVTLEGVVDNPMDKNIANQRALSITSVFGVVNHLQVRNPR